MPASLQETSASPVPIPPVARRRIAAFFAAHIAEIERDPALRAYGAALAAANVLTFVVWKFHTGVPLMIGRGADVLCWPFLEDCHRLQLPVFVVNDGLWGWLLLSFAAAYGFLSGRVTSAYWLTVFVNVVRVLVMLADYRLRANQHYWVVLSFLFLPGRRIMLHHALAALYFWAGTIKLDSDWITGVTLYKTERLWFPESLVPASYVYVVMLEMVLIWGLYARSTLVFTATLAQLVAFHLTSWPIVGFWYPQLMFCLLAILPLARWLPEPGPPATRWPHTRRVRIVHVWVLAVFAALQIVPRLFPGDTAVTGEGRLFALHMFDARVECEAALTYRTRAGETYLRALPEVAELSHRNRCDPIIYFDVAKNDCRELPPGVVDLDLTLRSKRASQHELRPVIDLPRFCSANPSYDMWRHNAWILAR